MGNTRAGSRLDPEMTLLDAIIALAKMEEPYTYYWTKSRTGEAGIAPFTIAKASGYSRAVIERKARTFERGTFWFTRTLRNQVPGMRTGIPECFLTIKGIVAVLSHLPTHQFKAHGRRARAQALTRLARMVVYSNDNWAEVEPFLASINVAPALLEEDASDL